MRRAGAAIEPICPTPRGRSSPGSSRVRTQTRPRVHPPAAPLGRRTHQRSINHCRRLDHLYEVTIATHERFLILSQIALLLRRLDRSQLFDTL